MVGQHGKRDEWPVANAESYDGRKRAHSIQGYRFDANGESRGPAGQIWMSSLCWHDSEIATIYRLSCCTLIFSYHLDSCFYMEAEGIRTSFILYYSEPNMELQLIILI